VPSLFDHCFVAKKHCRCKPPRIRGELQSKERASTFRSTNASEYKLEARSISEWFRPVAKQYHGLIRRPPYELYPLHSSHASQVSKSSSLPSSPPASPSVPTSRHSGVPQPPGQALLLKQLEQFIRLVLIVRADKNCIRTFLSSAKLVHCERTGGLVDEVCGVTSSARLCCPH
jgi:hypothetical protein